MFDIGWTEILVIVIVTILVVGPKELPGLLRTIGKTVGNMRRMAGDFQSQFNEALREAELEDVKNTIGDVRKLNPTNAIKDAVTKEIGSVDELTGGLTSELNEAKKDLDAAMKPSTGASNTATADLVEEEPSVAPVVTEETTNPAVEAPKSDVAEDAKAKAD